MRQRKIKNIDEKIEYFESLLIKEPIKYRGRWREYFGNDNPICLEIGSGKGKFISAHAAMHPEKNYIGIEGQRSVLLRALEKASVRYADIDKMNLDRESDAYKDTLGTQNIAFIGDFLRDILDIFAEGELDIIYLNFSDPWPKDRHAKRRLTYGKNLQGYARALAPNGHIEFKTDNDGLFVFSIEEIKREGFEILEYTEDLHKSDFISKDFTTEYEEKFKAMGKNINYVKFVKAKD